MFSSYSNNVLNLFNLQENSWPHCWGTRRTRSLTATNHRSNMAARSPRAAGHSENLQLNGVMPQFINSFGGSIIRFLRWSRSTLGITRVGLMIASIISITRSIQFHTILIRDCDRDALNQGRQVARVVIRAIAILMWICNGL